MDIAAIRSTVLTTPEWLRARAHEWALFIDIDGTLLEMAPTPDAVVVPEGLVQMMDDLSRTMGGAIALSTGRSVAEADKLLAPLRLITSGVHGTEVRVEPDGKATMLVPAVSATLMEEIHAVAGMFPGIIVELKGAGVAVHYRKVPEVRPVLEAELGKIADRRDTLVLRPGRRVLEVIPKGYSKGAGLAWLMRRHPFEGRRPIMVGDDYGDESAIRMAQQLGGFGLKVAGEYFPADEADFSGVAAARAWFATVAGTPTSNPVAGPFPSDD
jgi:trehalose 6-phosphate phosphatase